MLQRALHRVPLCHGFDSLALVAIAFAAYAALHQDAVYHIDSNALVRALAMPSPSHAHFGVLWILHAVHACCGDSSPVYQPILTASSASAALAVGIGHRALLACGIARSESFLAGLGIATTLGWSNFATVVEIHAFCLPPASLFWWSLAAQLRKTGWQHAAATGLASGVASSIHYSCSVLPLMGIATLALMSRRSSGSQRPLGPESLALLAAHAATFFGLQAVDAAVLGTADNSETVSWLTSRFESVPDLGTVVATAWHEWLLPFAPWSLGFLVAARHRGLRAATWTASAAWLGYLVVDLVVLQGWKERGAYALPMAIPTVALCAASWPRRWLLAGIVVGASLSVWNHCQQDPARLPTPEFGLAVQQYREHHPKTLFVLGGCSELDSVLVHCAPTAHHSIFEHPFTTWLSSALDDGTAIRQFLAWTRTATAGDASVFFSADAVRTLESIPRGKLLLEQCTAHCDSAVTRAGALEGLLVSGMR